MEMFEPIDIKDTFDVTNIVDIMRIINTFVKAFNKRDLIAQPYSITTTELSIPYNLLNALNHLIPSNNLEFDYDPEAKQCYSVKDLMHDNNGVKFALIDFCGCIPRIREGIRVMYLHTKYKDYISATRINGSMSFELQVEKYKLNEIKKLKPDMYKKVDANAITNILKRKEEESYTPSFQGVLTCEEEESLTLFVRKLINEYC